MITYMFALLLYFNFADQVQGVIPTPTPTPTPIPIPY